MLKDKGCINCLGVSNELANLSLRFRGFQEKNTLWHMYLKVGNNKYLTNKVRRSKKTRIKVRVIQF